MAKEYVKRSRADWQKVIEEQECSGKSQIEYCREMKISKNTFIKWRGLLKREVSGFVELKPKAEIGAPRIAVAFIVEWLHFVVPERRLFSLSLFAPCTMICRGAVAVFPGSADVLV